MQDSEVFKVSEALDRVDNDRELLIELVDMFFSEFDEAAQTMQNAINSGDARTLENSAHSQKSALGNIGAAVASDIAKELEYMGREQKLATAQARLDALITSVEQYRAASEEFKKLA